MAHRTILNGVTTIKNNIIFLTVLNTAFSVIWGGLGCYLTLMEVRWLLLGNRTTGVGLFLGIVGIILILFAIFIWNRRRGVKMVVGIVASFCSFFVFFMFLMAAAAGHWPSLVFLFALSIPIVGFLLSIISLFCLPPKNSKNAITEEQVSR